MKHQEQAEKSAKKGRIVTLLKDGKRQMAVNFDTRSVKAPNVTELYISATPTKNAPTAELAQEAFSGIRDILSSKGAHIFQERVFGTEEAIKIASKARSKAYGEFDDGVSPSYLVGKEGLTGPFAGVQVHAIRGDTKNELVKLDGTSCGRVLRISDRAYLSLSAISAPQSEKANEQAVVCFEKAEAALKQFGADFLSVPRTWMWLGDILAWYDDFNQARNNFFTQRGLIGPGSRQSMPASTGIGLGLTGGCKCAMDLTAVLKPADSTEHLQTTGKQQCASKYGSSFSRASRTTTLAGETVFVSGTASIDSSGATTHVGDAAGQIKETIENVQAVIKDMDVVDEDVIQVIAYCKTTRVEKIFNSIKDELPWPWVTVICDICRPDLLFEIEATAMADPSR